MSECDPEIGQPRKAEADSPAEDRGEPQYGLTSIFTPRQKNEFDAWIAAWAASMFYFWIWWFNPAHVLGALSYAIVTVVLVWVTFQPLYFLIVVRGAKKPSGALRLPPGSRVAMVVTKAPSEPFVIVAETLNAMLAQDYPHDTWLADEDPSPQTFAWCAQRGVGVSTRRGRSDYHLAAWPRRTRCKEGNLAYFYDQYGYENYDFVAQFDADHVPEPNYLREVLKPFADPAVGYVSAPSICDKNAPVSWSARSRLYVEATLHGPLQAGYNGGWAPLCIGSHYAVRTKALRQIGGLGPELAEDHSTSLMMNAKGWRGVHALGAIAHGDGPATFADLITQEFQWSRSLVTILIQYSPYLLGPLSARLRFQFLFSQFWYPLFSIFMALMGAMPIIALFGRFNFVNVSFPLFALHSAPISLLMLAIAYRVRALNANRPIDSRVLSWEGALFTLARWPWSLLGTLAAVRDWWTGAAVEFRVTPKGHNASGPLPFRVIAPYVGISLTSALIVLLVDHAGAARGFYIFATYTALLYAVLTVAILVGHFRENSGPRVALVGAFARSAVFFALLFIPAFGAGAIRAADGLRALAWGVGRVTFTEVTFGVAGAGQGKVGIPRERYKVGWRFDEAETSAR